MKKKPSKHYAIVTIVMLLAIGIVFIAVGMGVLIAVISSAVKAKDFAGGAVLVPIIFFGLLPIAAGSFAAFLGIKNIYLRVNMQRTQKYGEDGVAKIVGQKSARFKDNVNCVYYSLTLRYLDGEEFKTFTTDYIFDRNEFRYLKSLRNYIKIKTVDGFVVVAEDFPEKIYKIHPVFGVETAFFKQKTVAKILSVWRIVCIVAIVLLAVSIILTATLQEGIYLIVGASVFAGTNFIFMVIAAVYLIKWIKRKH